MREQYLRCFRCMKRVPEPQIISHLETCDSPITLLKIVYRKPIKIEGSYNRKERWDLETESDQN